MSITTGPDKKAHIEGSVWECQSDAKRNQQDKTETNISGDTIGQREAGYGFGGVFSSSVGTETSLCTVLVTLASLGPIQRPAAATE